MARRRRGSPTSPRWPTCPARTARGWCRWRRFEAAIRSTGGSSPTPDAAWSGLQSGRHVVVDPSLLTALRARVGDTLALGEARFVISGAVVSAPGNVGLRAAFGPRIFIPARFLEETRLLGFGARAEYEAYLRLPAGVSAQAIAKEHQTRLRGERVRVRTVADDRERLNETLSRLTGYLGLVALIALLLGGIGVASAVVVFIRQRMETIAVLRCLGATGRRVLAVYGVEAAGMALAGGLAGAAVGVGFQQALPGLLADLLPVDVETSVSWSAIALGVGMGLWVALVFALFPLLSVRRVPPLAALRRDYEAEPRPRDPWRWVVFVALAASTVALAAIQVGSLRQGAIFAAGVGVALLVLWAASWALVRERAALAPPRLAVSLAAGPVQSAPPLEPDGNRRAGDRLRRISPGNARAGPAQPAAAAPAHRRAGPAQPGALRHPAGPALRDSARAARGRTLRPPRRCPSCRCGSPP